MLIFVISYAHTVLKLESAQVARAGRTVAGPLSFELSGGRAAALVGPNGAGKTSLLAAVLGIIPLERGTISFEFGSLANPAARRQLGVVWQDGGLPLGASSRRWVEHLAKLYRVEPNQVLLSQLGLTTSNRPLRQQSGGEKQRYSLYSAFAHRPRLLVLDEPTVGLDDQTRGVFYQLMRDHLQRGGAALITSHYAQDLSLLDAQLIQLGTEEVAGVAIFNTDRPLDITGLPLQKHTNGYLLTSAPTDPLAAVTAIAAAQSAKVVSFVRL